MSNVPGGPGWLLGHDGKWYPPDVYIPPSEVPTPPLTTQPQYQSPMPDATPSTYGFQPGYQPPVQGGFQTGTHYEKSAAPRNSRKKAIIAIVIVLLLLIGGGTIGYMALSASSDNPTPEVNSFLSALIAKDVSTACKYATGVTTSDCVSTLHISLSSSFVTGSLKAANYQVSGNEALVSVVGQACGVSGLQSKGNKCILNTNPNYGLPATGISFGEAWTLALSSGSSIFTVPCEKINGTWYVYLQSAPPTSGNSGNSGSPTGSRQAESNLGNAIIELNVVYTENGGTFYMAGTNLVTQMQQGETNISYVTTTPNGPNDVQAGAGGTSSIFSQSAEAVAYSSVTGRCYAIFINKSSIGLPTSFSNSSLTLPSGTTYGTSTTAVPSSACTMGVESPPGIFVAGASGSISMDWQENGFPSS
ncbi:MAG: hypothetical protein HKL80_02485 [Acidimicrobiales bacterium]|nr:hypothetical protein [Acidimicrobiales bacterium]